MAKYSDDLVRKYINGDEIDSVKIDTLESDSKFMLRVLELSHDKNCFNLCSDELKDDFLFVEEVINLFKDDKDFIVKVGYDFAEGRNFDTHQVDVLEIIILLNNLCKDMKNYDKNFSKKTLFSILANTFYASLLIDVTTDMDRNKQPYDRNYLGEGFLYMEVMYNEFKIIKDFIAQKLATDIFGRVENLEKYLHLTFKKKEKLEGIGINNYMVSYLFRYDQSLSKYIACNTELLSVIRDKIQIILNRWDKYSEEEMTNIIEHISDSFYGHEAILSERCVFKYLSKKLDYSELYDAFIEYSKNCWRSVADFDCMLDDYEINKMFEENSEDDEELNINSLPFSYVRWLANLEKEVRDMIENGYQDSYVTDMKNNDVKKGKTKIIDFKKKNQ